MARPRKFDEVRVVGAAMDAFWRRGYEATSTRDLCDSTGLGPSSLYNTFGDKHQLYLRSLRTYREQGTAAQVALLRRPGPARERLRELLARAIDDDESDGPRGCFAINAAMERAAEDPEVKAEVRRNFDAVQAAIRETITRGQLSGELDPSLDAGAAARQLLVTYYGLRVMARTEDDRAVLLGVVDGALARLDTAS
ncbi:TetR/AcrR family transcriptional regulator [Pseudonocardia acaciae]|uniref:TetR/AcrR family transcriptional regulator n=1 Tax=Pseudonocardia acaciae TaxID=551276 RepID=UPI00048FA4D5|nr:TetR/AcrR family transcriptional regulator [Pseudonocardia acaciae]